MNESTSDRGMHVTIVPLDESDIDIFISPENLFDSIVTCTPFFKYEHTVNHKLS